MMKKVCIVFVLALMSLSVNAQSIVRSEDGKYRPMRKSPWQNCPMPNQISCCNGTSKKVNL
jgi:hypothetical protein